MEIPEHLELDVSGMAIGDTLRLVDLDGSRGRHLPRRPGGDGARDVTMPTRSSSPSPKRSRARSSKGELPEGEVAEGEEGAEGEADPEGEAGEGERPRLRRPRTRPRVNPCASSVGARAPRRSTCSSRGWAIPAASTSARVTTSAGSSSTSSRGGTAARGAPSSRARWPRCASATASSGCSKPETYMNDSGVLGGSGRALLQGRAGAPPRRARRRRPRARAAAGAGGWRARRAQRPALGRPALGSQEFERLRVGVGRPGRGDRRPVSDWVLSGFAPEDDLEALVARSADAVEAIAAEGLEAAQTHFN